MRLMHGISLLLIAGLISGAAWGQEIPSTGTPVAFDLQSDRPGQVEFSGPDSAVLFTREVRESFNGALALDFVPHPGGEYPAGFLHASPVSQPWNGTMWTRDAGTFMRELVFWGYYEHACQVSQCVMDFVGTNRDGFIAFPRYFSPQKGRQSGSEMDGQAATIIAMVALWQRLPPENPFRDRLFGFLDQPASPVRGIHHYLESGPLVPGSGEFGSGGGTNLYYNVVQNNLCALALLAAADMEAQAGQPTTARVWRKDARALFHHIEKYLVATNGAWIWCVDSQTLKPDPKIINSVSMAGVGGLNGVASMTADTMGFDPAAWPWPPALAQGKKTFDELYSFPLRREQFDKYGIWTQMNYLHKGLLTSPSYGQGYALQDMLLFDRPAMAAHGLEFLANNTYQAPGIVLRLNQYHYGRGSPYYFYERMYSPDARGQMELTAGCGPLNLINVSEPLKVARLIGGVDDTSLTEVKIIPRLPASWTGCRLSNWPIRTRVGMVRADIAYTLTNGVACFSLRVNEGKPIPKLLVRLPGQDRMVWKHQDQVETCSFSAAVSSR